MNLLSTKDQKNPIHSFLAGTCIQWTSIDMEGTRKKKNKNLVLLKKNKRCRQNSQKLIGQLGWYAQ